MPLVFVSYAHAEPAEVELAGLIAERLRRDGAGVFFDERLRTGQDWNEEIEQALDTCDAFCPLLSAASLASPMVQNEIARVGERRRRHGTPEIWPIRCRHDGRLPYDIGAHLRRIQYLTWQGEADTAFALDELLGLWRDLRDGPQPEPSPPKLCTLPGRIADFTGREPEIADLIAALCRADRRAAVSAIGGMGGAGKTTLAIEAAWRMADRFPDGILYIDMLGFGTAPPLTPAHAIAAVIEQLEPTVRLPDRLDQLLPLYRRLLAGRKLLLLLDNARETTQVVELVPPPPVALLVTSRHQIFLDGAARLDLDVMPAGEAQALLRGIVDERRASNAELGALAERCGRLPLALRTAGAYLQFRPGLKVAGYLALLSEEHRRLDHLEVPQANRDVRATLNLSVALLDADEPELVARWRRLAVFPTSFTSEAAAAIWNAPYIDPGASLDLLVSRSLLVFELQARRYRLHDLLRDVADEQLSDLDRQRSQWCHAEYFLLLAECANSLYLQGGAESLKGIRLFDNDWRNIQAGQSWAISNAKFDARVADLAAKYAILPAHLLSLRQGLDEQREWIEQGIEASRLAADVLGESSLLGNLGNVWRKLGNVIKAAECYSCQLILGQRLEDIDIQIHAIGGLGLCSQRSGKYAEAIPYFKDVLELALSNKDLRAIAGAYGNIGNCLCHLKKFGQAARMYKKQLEISRQLADRVLEGNALGGLGDIRARLGEFGKAEALYFERLRVAQQINDRRSEMFVCSGLGQLYFALGEIMKAITQFEKQVAIAIEAGDQRSEAGASWNLALAHERLSEDEQAPRSAIRALVAMRSADDPAVHMVEAWLRKRGIDPDAMSEPP